MPNDRENQLMLTRSNKVQSCNMCSGALMYNLLTQCNILLYIWSVLSGDILKLPSQHVHTHLTEKQMRVTM
jgi:hypothetical protein